METRFVTAGYGDSCTYPIGTCDPQCIDYEALMSMDESNHDDIVRELKENEYETQVEVGKKIAASDPSWFGEAASICLRYQAAKKKERRLGKNAGVLPTHAGFQSFDQLRHRRMRKRQN